MNAPTTPRQVLHSSATTEWYTPPWLTACAREVMDCIILDPASNEFANKWIKAPYFFNISWNGLSCPWFGNVWLNPPYGRQTKEWVKKWCNEDFYQGMLLVNNTTDRTWFRPLWNYWLCFFYKRIKFFDENGIEQPSPTHGNVLVYKGPNTDKFERAFSFCGRIVKPG